MNSNEFKIFMETKSEKKLLEYAENYQKGIYNFKSIHHEICFLYDLGLLFDNCYFDSMINDIFRKEDKFYYSLYYYLMAIKLYEQNKNILYKDDELANTMKFCYVNLGNEYSNQFRTISAIRYYHKALEIDNDFSMALGNYAYCIERHPVFIEFNGNDKVFNLICDLYNKVDLNKLYNGSKLFESKKAKYSSLKNSYICALSKGLNPNYNQHNIFEKISTDNTYENWCTEQCLWLNFVNDLGSYKEAQFDIDIYSSPQETSNILMQNMIDLYKNQREKLFNYKDMTISNNVIEICLVFNCFYSYFDKTSYWINKFFKLNCKEKDININTIWNKKTKNNINLIDYKNQYLYDIYWLRKEYRGQDNETLKINELLSPAAQGYRELRNSIEHRGYSLIDNTELYILEPALLYYKTVELAKIVRNLILSMMLLEKMENALTDPETGVRDVDLLYLQFDRF